MQPNPSQRWSSVTTRIRFGGFLGARVMAPPIPFDSLAQCVVQAADTPASPIWARNRRRLCVCRFVMFVLQTIGLLTSLNLRIGERPGAAAFSIARCVTLVKGEIGGAQPGAKTGDSHLSFNVSFLRATATRPEKPVTVPGFWLTK
jgi:hypothetical protein